MKFLLTKSKSGFKVDEGVKFLRRPLQPSSLNVVVIDDGLALDHALRFVDEGHQVLYWVPNIKAKPRLSDDIAGDGIVKKIEDIGQAIDYADLFYFGDNFFPYLVVWLKEKGKRVYGTTPIMSLMEHDRVFSWKTMKELGINVPEGWLFRGVDEVRDFIGTIEGEHVFIKFCPTPTNSYVIRASSVAEFDNALQKFNLGPVLHDLEFLVQKQCNGLEIGADAFVCPSGIVLPLGYGIEKKGSIVLATYKSDCRFLYDFYYPIHKLVQKDDYRCNLTIEGVLENGHLKIIDVSPRNGYPISSLYMRFIDNFVEVIVALTEDRIVEPKFTKKYMVQISVFTIDSSVWIPMPVDKEWLNTKGDGVAFRRVVFKDGKFWFVPGWDNIMLTVNAGADTYDRAKEKAIWMFNKVRDMIKVGEGDIAAFDELEGIFEQLRNVLGYEFFM